jgi:hypothetical protein
LGAWLAFAVVLVACSLGSGGPTERDLLPVADLVAPGTHVVRRIFDERKKGTTVDGRRFNQPAELNIQFAVDEPVEWTALTGWYRQQLETDGWRFVQLTNNTLEMTRDHEGLEHNYQVGKLGWPDNFDVDYSLREPGEDYK